MNKIMAILNKIKKGRVESVERSGADRKEKYLKTDTVIGTIIWGGVQSPIFSPVRFIWGGSNFG